MVGAKATTRKVTAEGKIEGQAFSDVNQAARPGSQAKVAGHAVFGCCRGDIAAVAEKLD